MKKTFATIFTLVILAAPVNYHEWKDLGNTFPAGYEGFVHYYNWLTPENQEKLVENGKYDTKGAVDVSTEQTISEWKEDFDSIR